VVDVVHDELAPERSHLIAQAAPDFYFFQNRGYPRPAALEWVGNRYGLTQLERQLLRRGVFGQATALRRRGRRCGGGDWLHRPLIVDGHNVHITVESAILGRTLLLANDGALRDLAGQSARFRLTEVSQVAQDWIFGLLGELRPRETLFLFDAPLSHSGLLADQYRRRLKASGLKGGSRAVPVPESEIPAHGSVAASSDQAVIDASEAWVDLARASIERSATLRLRADFSCLLSSRDPESALLDLPFSDARPW
jgi:hypothetical protein